MGLPSIILSLVKGVLRFPFGLMYPLRGRSSNTAISTSSGKGLCSSGCHNSSGFSFRVGGIPLISVKVLKPNERKNGNRSERITTLILQTKGLLYLFCCRLKVRLVYYRASRIVSTSSFESAISIHQVESRNIPA